MTQIYINESEKVETHKKIVNSLEMLPRQFTIFRDLTTISYLEQKFCEKKGE